jgi:hypothetical protein
VRGTARLATFAGGLLLVGAFAGAALTRISHAEKAVRSTGSSGLVLHVPHAAGPIVLDGDTDDPGWLKVTARTNAFVDATGAPAHPYSDARLVWGDGHLYVALYAADEDIRATHTAADAPLWTEDAFHMLFAINGRGERAIDVSPLGTITDSRRDAGGPFDFAWQSGAHVSHEVDGTLNRSDDDDEEWVIEMAIPFESLGIKGERGDELGFRVRRCDTPHHGSRVCASWGEVDRVSEMGTLVLD